MPASAMNRTWKERFSAAGWIMSGLLLGVSIGERIPSCLEPVKVRLTAPWTGVSEALGRTSQDTPLQESGTLIWQRPR
ncbi:Uncharacterised protein [Bordetella ansorpii]|uniref:Uncharacterized protein n=2 Tax=Bordetella ansorpii TaxID=288768 RepID=A0A157SNV5_9BORD|nr:Uncharacterised protein [Bordetella ansorpii]